MSTPDAQREAVLRRIRELQALAEHPNTRPEEAYAALDRLRVLLAKYQVTLEEAVGAERAVADQGGLVDLDTGIGEDQPQYLRGLLSVLAEHFGGKAYLGPAEGGQPGFHLRLVARKERKDAILTAFRYAALVCMASFLAARERTGEMVPVTREAMEDYGAGFTAGLYHYFAAQDKAHTETQALAKLDPEMQRYLRQLGLRSGGRGRPIKNTQLFAEGVKDGQAQGYAPANGLPRPGLPQ